MNKTKQRIEIARACGYDWLMYNGRPCMFEPIFWIKNPKYTNHVLTDAEFLDEYNLKIGLGGVPHYLDSLDAMHEAENQRFGAGGYSTKWAEWEMFVAFVARRDNKTNEAYLSDMCRLSAVQRAEAFLRTIGKWKEE